MEKFEALIEAYNAGSRNIEELFEELLRLSRNLSEEQQRHVRENMTEEELVVFDIPDRIAESELLRVTEPRSTAGRDHSAKIRSIRCAMSRAVSTSAAWLPGCSEIAQPV